MASGNTNNILPNESKVIVLLGETGVGKTSFIKSICLFENFVEFSQARLSFDSVIESDLGNNEGTTFGQRSNIESGDRRRSKSVESDTKVCKIYNVKFGDQCYSIVDTPGIGDTNGLEQDSINWQHIFTTISSFPAIHSICVLLKQGDNRTHSFFQYCISQILSNLPKAAALANLVIVITHGHGFHFDAENIMTILKSSLTAGNFSQVSNHITDQNIFCVDNQFIKYFEVVKSGNSSMVHAELKEKSAHECWDVSRQEVLRLLQHTSNQVPIPSDALIELNIVKTYLTGISQLIVDMTSTIVEDMLSASKLTATIQDILEKKQNLESVATQPVVTTRTIMTDKPWYSCQTPRCKENRRSPADRVQVECQKLFPIDLGPIEYGTFTVLKTISPALPYALSLLKLPPAITNLTQINCSDCGCSLACHEASCTKIITETIQVKNEIVQGMINNNCSQVEALTSELQKRQDELVQLEVELEIMLKILAKMMYYLKQISTQEFKELNQGDLVLERLDGIMTMNGSNSNILELLNRLKNKYLLYMNEVQKENIRFTLRDIKTFKEELRSLPMNGGIIASLLNTLPDIN